MGFLQNLNWTISSLKTFSCILNVIFHLLLHLPSPSCSHPFVLWLAQSDHTGSVSSCWPPELLLWALNDRSCSCTGRVSYANMVSVTPGDTMSLYSHGTMVTQSLFVFWRAGWKGGPRFAFLFAWRWWPRGYAQSCRMVSPSRGCTSWLIQLFVLQLVNCLFLLTWQ